MEIYPPLGIKQIKNDTLAHILLTRISALHPSSNKTEPLLKEALKIYETSRNQTPGMLVLAYERGSYAQMMGFLEFADRASRSVCRGMWEIKERRLARPRPSLAAQQKNGELMRDGDENIWDNRDFSVVISCERSSQRPFEETFRVGATSGENWAKGFSAVERLVEHFLTLTTSKIQSRSTSYQSNPYPRGQNSNDRIHTGGSGVPLHHATSRNCDYYYLAGLP
ncbi:N-acetyltransferase B complex non catalytic subunit-domain-containing protein [Tuber borchii]|uniref:N-acetyltransferase B complex non catalytic subunit-domain-containing protein n=1 Tax=Tuber borchii TaxID=42251 RepID=A0A2T6ZJX4_TUBBO|nr:N-acetyltransferase B complex non catalytic subunit-domain-containing protein [Tuber borchii]